MLFSYIYFRFAFFILVSLSSLFIAKYFIYRKNSHLSAHLSGFKQTISQVVSKNTRILLLLLLSIFMAEFFMLRLIVNTDVPHHLFKSMQPILNATFAFGSFAVMLIVMGYYFITMREIAQLQTNYFVEKLNTHQHVLEEQVEKEVLKRQEKEHILSHQARLAAMGEMISNITHQWRQPLTAISNIVQEMQDAYKHHELDDKAMQTNTQNIRAQLNLMSHTIDDFRHFFSPSKISTTFYAKDQVKTTLMMLRGMLQKHNISVDLYIDGDIAIKGYANEYNHVLINIFNNARDVFIERSIEAPRLSIHVNDENNHSVVTISDNGGGINDEYLDKIFDPYFTTKDEKHGTGIGLYMCKQIIENNMHGHFSAHNNEDGAVFTITV